MQDEAVLRLLGGEQAKAMSIEDSASLAGVSSATIRNWIKTGYLTSAGRGMVAIDSLERFGSEFAGKLKLKQRANKSLKDNHDHDEITSFYLEKIANRPSDYALIGAEYEMGLSDSYRNKEGVYYTPGAIIDELLIGNVENIETATFCDPCCGSGNFIARALSLGFKPENIYAFDTDPVAVELTRRRIFHATGFAGDNIVNADFLKAANIFGARKFDHIYTNPPWGKKIDKKEREAIGRRLSAGASMDTCSLFFFACLNVLADGGRLGLLLPEAFFNISSHENARMQALRHEIDRIIDFGKPFGRLISKAQAIILRKRENTGKKFIVCESKNALFKRTASSFSNNPKSIFNLYCSQEDADTIAHVFSLPHVTLKNNAKWALGIVTGCNAKFVKNKPAPGLIPVFKGADITKTGLADPTCFIPSDTSLYQQVAPLELYTAREKLVYKFISSRLSFFHDSSQRFFLNSANILIPNADFPVKMRIVGDLLNSGLMNWMFSKIFNTHKILRADLESLPIHSQFLQAKRFDEDDFLDKLGVERMGDGSFRAI